MMIVQRFFQRLSICIALLFTVLSAHAEQSIQEEYIAKAKIIRFLFENVSWPPSSVPKDTFNLCLLGKFPIIKPLTDLNGLQINHHKVVVKKLPALKDADQSCQLIYIAPSDFLDNKKLIANFTKLPVLLISDSSDFADAGGTMNFLLLNDQVGLTINLESAKASKLVFDLHSFGQITIVPESKEITGK